MSQSDGPRDEDEDEGDSRSDLNVLVAPPPTLIGGMTPLQFTMMTLVLCNEAIGTTMLFPYVGFLVAKVDGSNDRSAAGYYSGMLVGTFQLGQMFFSARWGYVSDCIGRRPVFIVGLVCGGMFVICFGLSSKLWMLMVFRLLHGVTCANAAVGKTYTAEVVTGVNRAKAFGTMSLSWAVGSLIGPTIGGFLYDPCTNDFLSQLPPFQSCEGLFGNFPALLPSVVLAFYSFSSAIAIYLFLPESNARAVPARQWIASILASWFAAATNRRRHVASEFAPLPSAEEDEESVDEGTSPVEEEAAAVVALEDAIQPSSESFAAAAMTSHSRHQHHHDAHSMTSRDLACSTVVEMREMGSKGVADDGGEERTRCGEDPHARSDPEQLSERGEEKDDLETLADPSEVSDGIVHPEDDDNFPSETAARIVAPSRPDSRLPNKMRALSSVPPVMAAQPSAVADEDDVFTWTQLRSHPVLSKIIPMYMALCAYNISFAEVMPLYAIAFLKDGGLELSSSNVGIIFAANALMSLGANVAFGYIAEKVRYLRLWRISCVVYAITIPLMGTASIVSNLSHHNVALILGLLCLLSAFRVTTSGFQFSLCMMFVANGAPPRHLGRVTGMSHACGSISRSLAPVIAAPLFAWSISGGDHHIFPANHYFLFILCSLASLCAYWLSTRLSEEDVMHKPQPPAAP